MQKAYELLQGKIVESTSEDAPVLVFINPDDNEKKFIRSQFNVDEHTLNSALDPKETPRLEFEPDHAAIIMNRPKSYSSEDQFEFKVASTGVFLFSNRVIVVLDEDVPIFRGGKKFARVNSLAGILLYVLNLSTVHFMNHLECINSISDDLEGKINTSLENKYLLYLFRLEKSLVYLVNAIHSNERLIEKLRHNAAKLGLTTEEQELLEDIQIENNEYSKQAEIYSSIIAGLMDARVSIVSNNLNQLMKKLNMIMIAVMWPALVSSFFAMNVALPVPQHGTLIPFYICLTLAFGPLIAGIIYLRLKRNNIME
ncbi:MAG: magnesium transporter CorA family protein [Candidatus Glassbacteria bacterium]